MSEISAVFIEKVPYIACRPVPVVGRRLNNYCDAARSVSFVCDLLVIDAFASTRRLLMLLAMLSFGKLAAFALGNDIPQPGIGVRV